MVGVDNENPDKWGEGGHWIVLSEYNKDSDQFTFYDSARWESDEYQRNISGNELKEDWDGYAIAITAQCNASWIKLISFESAKQGAGASLNGMRVVDS